MKDNTVKDELTPEEIDRIANLGAKRNIAIMKRIIFQQDGITPRKFSDTPALMHDLVDGIIELVNSQRKEAGEVDDKWDKHDAKLAMSLLQENTSAMLESLSYNKQLQKILDLLKVITPNESNATD